MLFYAIADSVLPAISAPIQYFTQGSIIVCLSNALRRKICSIFFPVCTISCTMCSSNELHTRVCYIPSIAMPPLTEPRKC